MINPSDKLITAINRFAVRCSDRPSDPTRCDESSLVLPNIVLTLQHLSSEDRKVLGFLERISEVQRNRGD
jgi:hypothetical protein